MTTPDLVARAKAITALIVQDQSPNWVEHMETYISPTYIQTVNGTTLNYEGLISHMRAQKGAIKSISLEYEDIFQSGNQVAAVHFNRIVKNDGSKVLLKVVAVLAFGEDGKLERCDECARVLDGGEADGNLTSMVEQ
ncbi:hypothetical protein HDV00_012089 [Rhizophlyctis rosea]|nr:hypothetical protein HDV00_012089 [Rhizophlyctis rosea]